MLKRDVVINLVASLIGPNHKVDLTNPEKVIIVEIYQVFYFCP
jgi:tRNA acetyltransferase TAN1